MKAKKSIFIKKVPSQLIFTLKILISGHSILNLSMCGNFLKPYFQFLLDSHTTSRKMSTVKIPYKIH